MRTGISIEMQIIYENMEMDKWKNTMISIKQFLQITIHRKINVQKYLKIEIRVERFLDISGFPTGQRSTFICKISRE